ncbi:DUF1415 domain-containing protein [Litoribacillus peritrichatus]
MPESLKAYELQTRAWVEKVIVGFNFCPFAKKEVVRDSIRYAIFGYEGSGRDVFFDALEEILKECRLLDEHSEIETTLVVFPKLLGEFEQFLDFLGFAEQLMIDNGYEGIYQLANFHPDYCFEGESQGDPSNYTNRSPYPTFHIIREETMEKVLANISDPEEIPARNIRVAREMGNDRLALILKGCMESANVKAD